jgi:hypothetical protein
MTAGSIFFVVCRRSAERQREAVALIRNRGGQVYYSYQANAEHEINTSSPPPWPSWAVNAIGIDFFSRIVAVEIDDAQLSESDKLELLRLGINLPELELVAYGTM